MGDTEHIEILRKGVDKWNQWRRENPSVKPNLAGVNFRNTYLGEANLSHADLREADLSAADLRVAYLGEADLRAASLREADLMWADLMGADLRQVDLTNASLERAILVETRLEQATLIGCRVYGASVWDVQLDGAIQTNLIITRRGEPTVQVDRLNVAQLIHLLLNNKRIRDVIDTITSKVILILGRFTLERKVVLDAVREELRRRDYLPAVFDFVQLCNQSTMETVATLAHMSRFVIADLTDAKSVLQELQGIVPNRPSLPVQPLLLTAQAEPGMFDFFRLYPWVLATQYYDTVDELLANVAERVIEPAERKLAVLRPCR